MPGGGGVPSVGSCWSPADHLAVGTVVIHTTAGSIGFLTGVQLKPKKERSNKDGCYNTDSSLSGDWSLHCIRKRVDSKGRLLLTLTRHEPCVRWTAPGIEPANLLVLREVVRHTRWAPTQNKHVNWRRRSEGHWTHTHTHCHWHVNKPRLRKRGTDI